MVLLVGLLARWQKEAVDEDNEWLQGGQQVEHRSSSPHPEDGKTDQASSDKLSPKQAMIDNNDTQRHKQAVNS